MRLYIAGPMTGVPEKNFPAFASAAKWLRARGHDVVSPAELTLEDGHPWAYYMRRDIAALVTCDGIALLPGAAESKGARLELHIALELGLAQVSLTDL